jgi:hypothetical protein
MIDRLLRVENLVVIPLVLIAVLVALGARWRGHPRYGRVAAAITVATRLGFALLVATIALLGIAIVAIGPIGNP